MKCIETIKPPFNTARFPLQKREQKKTQQQINIL